MKKLQIPKWVESLARTQPVEAELIVRVHGRRIVSIDDISEAFGITRRMADNYVKEGMPSPVATVDRVNLYDFEAVRMWRDANIDRTRGKAVVKARREAVETPPEDENNLTDVQRKARADANKAEEDAKIAELKRRQLEGSLIASDDVDTAMAELAVIYQTGFVNDKKVLPAQLAEKPSGFIRKYLDEHYANRMADLDRHINRGFSESDRVSLYDIVQAVLQKAKEEDLEPRDIIEAL